MHTKENRAAGGSQGAADCEAKRLSSQYTPRGRIPPPSRRLGALGTSIAQHDDGRRHDCRARAEGGATMTVAMKNPESQVDRIAILAALDQLETAVEALEAAAGRRWPIYTGARWLKIKRSIGILADDLRAAYGGWL